LWVKEERKPEVDDHKVWEKKFKVKPTVGVE